MDAHDKGLWAGSAFGWVGWFFSHVREINDVLQTVLLLTSIAATIVAIVYHRSRTKR